MKDFLVNKYQQIVAFFHSRNNWLLGITAIAFFFTIRYDNAAADATVQAIVSMMQAFWAVLLAHFLRKVLLNYPEADWQELFAGAKDGKVACGLALIASAIIFVGLLFLFSGRANA